MTLSSKSTYDSNYHHILRPVFRPSTQLTLRSQKYKYPIYTLPTLSGRTYIITSPSLAASIQRTSRSTSFYSAILEVTKRICAFDKVTMDIIWKNVNGGDGAIGLMPESHNMIASVLEPGPILNEITKLQLATFTDILGKLDYKDKGAGEVDLLDWVRDQFSVANVRAIYGPENIFDMHPELVKEFWTFEQGLVGLLANILPSITARKAYVARSRVFDGLIEYVRKERYKKASPLIQKRVAINLKHNLTTKMTAHGELIMLFAILGNAVPVAFWLLVGLFSRVDLLQEVREEIVQAVTVGGSRDREGEIETRTIHIDLLKLVAPVFVSSFRETLRMVANLTSVRWILEDIVIGGQYLLKENSIVQVASGVTHMEEKTWGMDAGEFNPRRFIDISTTSTEKSTIPTQPLPGNVPSAAFRAFGGGSVICPGRHFAQSEILGFVAAIIMRFDLEKLSGGTIELPKRNNEVLPIAVMKPKSECKVRIKTRVGLENVIWELDL